MTIFIHRLVVSSSVRRWSASFRSSIGTSSVTAWWFDFVGGVVDFIVGS
ncbi:hypothetical protein ACXZ9C_10710 [Streptococcus agalactiae]